MQVISLYWLRAGYVRRLRCRSRRANAWWCRSSMRCACAAYKKQLSQGLFFAVFLILQSSERRLFSKAVFFFQRPFWELPSRASGGSISGTSFARNFFASDRLSQVLFFLSFFSIFLLVLCSFLCRGEGNFCRWCESLSFFGLREGRVSVLLLVFFPSVFSRGAISFF